MFLSRGDRVTSDVSQTRQASCDLAKTCYLVAQKLIDPYSPLLTEGRIGM